MRVPRKLGEQSETHPHGDIAKRLRIGVLTTDALWLIAIDLEMAVLAQLELAFTFNGLGIRRHCEYITGSWKLRLINGTLTNDAAFFSGVYWLFHPANLLESIKLEFHILMSGK